METSGDYGEKSLCFLMQSLARVLSSTGQDEVAACLPWQPLWSPQPSPALSELPANREEDCLQALGSGLDAAALAQSLETLRIEPVLTAHPTEAKRQTVLPQLLLGVNAIAAGLGVTG